MFTFNSFGGSKISQSTDHVPQHFTSKQDVPADGSSQQLSEKYETETESDFEIQALILPFSAPYLFFEISQQTLPASAEPLAEKTTHPIYVSVCNFRI